MDFVINSSLDLINMLGLDALLVHKNRIFFPYILSSIFLAFAYFRLVYIKKKPDKSRSFLQYLFPKSIWLHRSAYIDYQLFIVNNILKVLLIAPYMMVHISFAYCITSTWEWAIGYKDPVIWAPININVLYSLLFLLVADFSRFLLHYCFHKVPFLWHFHKVHHTAEVMTPITLYRVHPFEYICHKMRSVFIFGCVTGSFYFWFRTSLQPLTILQIHAALFLFNLLGANLRHSHIPIGFGKYLEHLFISPAQHQIHHSNAPAFYDKNFGSTFAVWDKLFGTLVLSHANQKISFGISEKEQKEYKTFSQNLFNPIKRLFKPGSHN